MMERESRLRISSGARALLFDRLIDLDPTIPTEPQPLRTLNRRELRESVRREVERLLNTRCPIPAHLLDERERTVIDYGIPDLAEFGAHKADDHKRLALIFTQTIAAFEPRLRRVRVSVERLPDTKRGLVARIEGLLVVESVTEPVSFPIVIRDESGESRSA